MATHRDRIAAIFAADPDIRLLTNLESITKGNVLIKYTCPHKDGDSYHEILARDFKGNSCDKCKKTKKLQQIQQQILPPQININDYQVIELIDEQSNEFTEFDSRKQEQVHVQNEVINRLLQQNVYLLSEYVNITAPLDIVCQHGHETQINWKLAKNYGKKMFCSECANIKRTIQATAKIKKHSTDEELTAIGQQYGFTFIRRTETNGQYQWRCPNGHIITKTVQHIKNGHCTECEREAIAAANANIPEERLVQIQQAKARKSQLQKNRVLQVQSQRTK